MHSFIDSVEFCFNLTLSPQIWLISWEHFGVNPLVIAANLFLSTYHMPVLRSTLHILHFFHSVTIIPFWRWWNWSMEWLSDFSKVTQLGSGRTRTGTPIVWLQTPLLSHLPYFILVEAFQGWFLNPLHQNHLECLLKVQITPDLLIQILLAEASQSAWRVFILFCTSGALTLVCFLVLWVGGGQVISVLQLYKSLLEGRHILWDF